MALGSAYSSVTSSWTLRCSRGSLVGHTMILTLEVIGHQAAALGANYRKEFGSAGGTIGRLPDNDWVLPDAYISGRHARIQFRSGQFFLEDTSSNGVSINSPDNRLPRGRPHALNNGDRLFIDAYEIKVTIGKTSQRESDVPLEAGPVPVKSRGAPEDPFASPAGADPFAGLGDPLADAIETDPMKLLGIEGRKNPAPRVPRAADLVAHSPMSDHFRTPSVSRHPTEPFIPNTVSGAGLIPEEPQPAPGLIPSDYDPLAPDESAKPRPAIPQRAAPAARQSATPPGPGPSPKPTPSLRPSAPAQTPKVVAQQPAPPITPATAAPPRVPEQAPSQRKRTPVPPVSTDLDFMALLRGAGLEGVEVSPELATQFGQILRVVIEGLMDILHARERIKDEFRMRVTTFKTKDNNPLKFSANVDDALHNLLVKRHAAYLKPIEAFEDAFRDVRNHQVAMLAGVRVAYEAMLNEFEPGHLQAEFDRQLKKGAFLGAPARFKYWDLYAERFRDRVRDADSCFRELFGDEFARAYEEQLQKLRTLQQSDNG
jgi:type VI secretion system FHA domain protein